MMISGALARSPRNDPSLSATRRVSRFLFQPLAHYFWPRPLTEWRAPVRRCCFANSANLVARRCLTYGRQTRAFMRKLLQETSVCRCCYVCAYIRSVSRQHRSTTYVGAAHCYRPSSVVCRSVTLVSHAKTAEPIDMLFGLRNRVGT